MQRRLREALSDLPLVGEVRGVGLVAGLEIVADKTTKQSFDPKLNVPLRIFRKTLEQGVIVRPIPNTVAISPPLVITESEIEELIGALGKSLVAVADGLAREGAIKG